MPALSIEHVSAARGEPIVGPAPRVGRRAFRRRLDDEPGLQQLREMPVERARLERDPAA